VKTVSVLATVRDKHGKIIPNLGKEGFSLTEGGYSFLDHMLRACGSLLAFHDAHSFAWWSPQVLLVMRATFTYEK